MNKLKNFLSKYRYAICFGAFMFLFAFAGHAQGEEVLDTAKRGLSDLLDNLVGLLKVVMALGALVVLAIVIFKVFKGDREAAEKLAWWVAGLTLGFVLMTVVQNIVQNV